MKPWQHFKTITRHRLLVMMNCFRIGLIRQGKTTGKAASQTTSKQGGWSGGDATGKKLFDKRSGVKGEVLVVTMCSSFMLITKVLMCCP